MIRRGPRPSRSGAACCLLASYDGADWRCKDDLSKVRLSLPHLRHGGSRAPYPSRRSPYHDSGRPRPRRLCSARTASDNDSAAGSEGTTGFPVTIEHAYGETTITEKPERIATVAWANHEVPLALGVVPVGMSKATWGDDDNDGVLPWVEDKLEELGAETPVLFDETDGIDFEAVADTAPDVILAAYSGLTQEEYDTLSKIAPSWPTPRSRGARRTKT